MGNGKSENVIPQGRHSFIIITKLANEQIF